jgi:succinate dehydrogenase / fumarate reductase cytochrome b subunit
MSTTLVSSAAPAAAPAEARPVQSTIGRKVIMATTGIVLVGFVIGHMIGNLQVFLGPEALDAYGAMLRHMLHGAGLWIVRFVLLAAVLLHIGSAWSLWRSNKAARPVGYRMTEHRDSTYASRTMYWSGPILLLFIVYHLLHLTTGTAHPSFEEGRVYHNVVAGFQVWPVSAFYIAAMVALGLHMQHGIWSMTQTLGLSHPHYERLRRGLSAAVTLLVVLGNISIPVAVLVGWVK